MNEFARQTPWLHDVFTAYALWGGLVVLAGMLIAGYLVGRRRDRSVSVVSAVVCAGVGAVVALLLLVVVVLRPAVGRLASRMAGTRLYPLVASRPGAAPRRAPVTH